MKPSKVSKNPPPGWPPEEDLRKVLKKMEKGPFSRALPENPTAVDRFKYDLCRQFVIYLMERKLTQRELAKRLNTTEARVSEIVHYHLDKVTTDRLIGYLGIIKPKFTIKIAV